LETSRSSGQPQTVQNSEPDILEWSVNVGQEPTDVKFSPDGQLIAVTQIDGKIELWDLRKRLVFEFEGAKEGHFEFSPDGKWVIFANKENQLQVNPITLDGLLERSCDRLKEYFSTNPDKANDLKTCPSSR